MIKNTHRKKNYENGNCRWVTSITSLCLNLSNVHFDFHHVTDYPKMYKGSLYYFISLPFLRRHLRLLQNVCHNTPTKKNDMNKFCQTYLYIFPPLSLLWWLMCFGRGLRNNDENDGGDASEWQSTQILFSPSVRSSGYLVRWLDLCDDEDDACEFHNKRSCSPLLYYYYWYYYCYDCYSISIHRDDVVDA